MAPKAPPTHPKYVDIVKDALVSLKERNGSSVAAIRKFISGKYTLPTGWEKVLSVQLKKLVASGKIVKVSRPYSPACNCISNDMYVDLLYFLRHCTCKLVNSGTVYEHR